MRQRPVGASLLTPASVDLGQQQAEKAAEALQQHVGSDTLLLSSPLQRARETAIPLARMLQRDVIIEDVFREIPSPVPLAAPSGLAASIYAAAVGGAGG